MGFGVAHITNDDWRTERTLPPPVTRQNGGRWIVKGKSGWGAIPHPSVLPNPPSEWLKKKSEIDPALAKLDALTAFNLENLWKELVAESCGQPRVVTYPY